MSIATISYALIILALSLLIAVFLKKLHSKNKEIKDLTSMFDVINELNKNNKDK